MHDDDLPTPIKQLVRFGFGVPLGAALGTLLVVPILMLAAWLGWTMRISGSVAVQALLAACAFAMYYGAFWRRPDSPDPLGIWVGVLFGFVAAVVVAWMAGGPI